MRAERSRHTPPVRPETTKTHRANKASMSDVSSPATSFRGGDAEAATTRPRATAPLTPRYQMLGCSQPDRLAYLTHVEVAKHARQSVVPPPPPPSPPPPPPPPPPIPTEYYLHRRHMSGRELWHHQRFGRGLTADFREQPWDWRRARGHELHGRSQR